MNATQAGVFRGMIMGGALMLSAVATGTTLRPTHFLTEGCDELVFFDQLDPRALARRAAMDVLGHATGTVYRQPQYAALLDTATASLSLALDAAVRRGAMYDDSGVPFVSLRGRLPSPVGAVGVLGTYGDRARPESYTTMRHLGLSFPAPEPLVVSAIARGVVIHVGLIDGLGRVVIVDHGDAYFSVIAQMIEVDVVPWQAVEAGERLGLGGSTSTFGEREVYFELRHEGVPIDPTPWLAPTDGSPRGS